MPIAQSKVTAQGQISVPVEVRRKLGVGPGSILERAEEGDKIVEESLTIIRLSKIDLHRGW